MPAGHCYEAVWLWTKQVHAAIGGTVFATGYVRGSVPRVPNCATEPVSYCNTGLIGSSCDGTPAPKK
ncbi:hypothetical protein ABT120_58245 [Nonomuraea angiospora]|uniref:hypothetical protein n=1 Tax=Nonomuraea angiospora TaxID=46172 RepID=UPI003322D318